MTINTKIKTNPHHFLPALSHKLPRNLWISSPDTKKGEFEVGFLARLTDKQLADLNKEAKKKSRHQVSFQFFKKDSEDCPHAVYHFQDLKFDDILKIEFSGDTIPYLHNTHSAPEHYISVVFWYI